MTDETRLPISEAQKAANRAANDAWLKDHETNQQRMIRKNREQSCLTGAISDQHGQRRCR